MAKTDDNVHAIHRRPAQSGKVSYGDAVPLYDTSRTRVTLVPFFIPHRDHTELAVKITTYRKRPPPDEWAVVEEKSLSLNEEATRRAFAALQDHLQVVTRLVAHHPVCSRLTALGGIGPIGAVLLYAALGSGQAFANGREFAAYLGLTPRQYSSGGKTNLVGLSKKIGNHQLRSVLIQAALAYVYRMKEPKGSKDRWLRELIDRAGPRRAAVALANKNVRTAWALLTRGTDYERRTQLRMAA